MPEGDTVHRLAGYLAPRLEGRVLRSGRLAGEPTLELAGQRVERVTARGKHLLVELGGARTLRTHLGMHGSWHRYAPGEPWKRPTHQASLVLETEDDVLVCFHAQELEWMRADGARARELERRLGPDLTGDSEPDLGALPARARALLEPSAPLVDVLLHQPIAAGIGNVYKSELLFLAGLDPLTALESVEDSVLCELFAQARRLLRANLVGASRRTRPEEGRGQLWVYRRGGQPCLRCGTRIRRAGLGRRERSTYWCPGCQ